MPAIADVDVVVVSHDHAATLPATLAAIEGLAPRPRSVVVVDNASGDASADLAASFAGGLPLEAVRTSSNLGFAAGLNLGLARGSSTWALSLNPDCAPRTDLLARLLEAVAASGCADEIGAVTPRLLRAAGDDLRASDVLDAAGMIVTPSGRHLDRGAGEIDRGQYDRTAWVFGGTGAATLYRRAALADVAYPDGQVLAESFFAYREDAELAWRLQWRGWRSLYAPAAVAVHRRGLRPEAARRGHDLADRLSVANRFLLRAHCADLGWHLRCLPWWLLRDVLVFGACLTVEQRSLPGLARAWQLRADALARRRHVLGRALVSSRRVSRWFRRGGCVEEVAF